MAGPRPRGIDFIVYGVGRSGTTATADGLNAVPGVVCVHELFRPHVDHTAIQFPESFLSADVPETMQARVRSMTDPALIGSKTPYYFFDLARFAGATRDNHAILCTRPLADVGRSWSARQDPRHPRPWVKDGGLFGKTGVIGILEMPLAMAATVANPDLTVTVLPYRALKGDPAGTIRLLVDRLEATRQAPPPTGWQAERAAQPDSSLIAAMEERGRRHMDFPKPATSPAEAVALDLIGAAEIDAILDRPAPFDFAEVREAVAGWLSRVPQRWWEQALPLLGDSATEDNRSFTEGWQRRAAALVKRLSAQGVMPAQSPPPRATARTA